MSFPIFSQKDTSRVCIPYHVAQKIAIELTQKDSLVNELDYTQKILLESKNTIRFQDSTIRTFDLKEIEYKKEIQNLETQNTTHTDKVKSLQEENQELNRKNKNLKSAVKWLGGGLAGTLATLALIILI